MKHGNWVPLSKALVKYLPYDREYSKVEAAYSLQVDFDCGRKASVSGYSKLWGWSRKRVRTFLKNMGVSIEYKDKKTSPHGGQVGYQVGDKKGTSSGQVRLINSKYLHIESDKQGTSRGQAGDKQGNTTKDPNTNLDPKPKNKYSPLFEKFWKKYPKKIGKAKAGEAWKKKGCDSNFDKIMQSLNEHINSHSWKKENGQYIPHGSTWVNGEGWEDEPNKKNWNDEWI